MKPTPIIDMFSGTGELAMAIARAFHEPTSLVSFSDSYGPARKYLKRRFPGAEAHKDFRDQVIPRGSIVTIGAPCQDLSIAGKRAGNAVVGLQARLMLQRGLTAINHERNL